MSDTNFKYKKNKKYWVIFSIIAICFLIISFIYTMRLMEIDNSNYTIGEIERFDFHVNGTEAYITYEVDEQQYHHWCSKSRYKINVIGEKFMIAYDSKDPSKSNIERHRPIFLQNEKTEYIEGKVVEFYFNQIRFTYEVNGQTYKKSQHFLKQDFNKYKSLISIGDVCLIRYWIENPKRSIIYLDKSVK